MKSEWALARRLVLEASKEMEAMGLVTGTSGNVSMRLGGDEGAELMAVTPSAVPYSTMAERHIVIADFDIEPVEGEFIPSVESPLHVEIYRRRPDAGAVVHTHSVYTSVMAVAGLELPPLIDEMVIRIGGPVGVSEYAFPGSQELADSVCDALEDRKAALIRNHGAVAVGSDLQEALEIAALIERVAQVFLFSRLLGSVTLLPPDIVETEAALYRMKLKATTDGQGMALDP